MFTLATPPFTPGAEAQERPIKKLIGYAGDVPGIEFIQRHIREMERRPFNGIFVHTRKLDHAFDIKPWNPKEIRQQADAAAKIEWRRFTDNFISLHATNTQNMDWFNDEHWNIITSNLKLFTEVIRAGKFKGVAWDTEQYGNNCWLYPGRYQDKSFEEVSTQVLRRGAQFMEALQREVPEIKILSLFQLSLFGLVMDEPDRKIREERLTDIPWHNQMALLPYFFVGMLEAAGPGIQLIDGNEHSYYYETTFDYYHKYHMIKQRAKVFVPKELWKKYDAQATAGMALFMEQILGLRMDQSWMSTFLSHSERLKYLEHNTYYALTTADEYVWCYSSDVRWFQNYTPGPDEPAPRPDMLPENAEEAMISAIRKHERGEPLGFCIETMVENARKGKARHRFEVPNGN